MISTRAVGVQRRSVFYIRDTVVPDFAFAVRGLREILMFDFSILFFVFLFRVFSVLNIFRKN